MGKNVTVGNFVFSSVQFLSSFTPTKQEETRLASVRVDGWENV